MSGLNIKTVENFSQAVDIAGVRNQTREFMTHSQEQLTYADQLDWFYNVYQPAYRENRIRAFAGYMAAKPAAYGLISERQGKFWLTGAVAPEFQGHGNGRALFEFLTAYTVGLLDQPEVYLDVLETNERARSLYEKLGYQALEPQAEAGVIVMKYEAPNAGPR